MADSILRLKVDSQEYDNKLKRATEGLQRYAEGCKKAGGTLAHLDDGVEEFVKSLGNMDTVSKSAKGSINEMTKSFTELSVVYNKLTEEEKNSPFGKALNDSLNTLKSRIQEGNVEIKNISDSLNGGGGLKGALDQVASKFGINIDMVTKFGGVVGVATTALKVAKDAFFQSESNIDEWGRTVKSAEGAYDIFLQTLNNGNWSNFFTNLSQAIRGARDLYDAFDRLNSIKANNAVAIATTKAEIQQLRLLKQQGQDVDAKLKDATQRLAALQAQSANAGINAGKGQVVNTLRNGVNSIGGAPINDATLKYAADRIAKDGQSFFDTMKRRAAALEAKGTRTVVTQIDDGYGGTVNKYRKVFDITLLSKEQQKQYALAKTITERETEIQKGLTVWSQSVNEQASNAREQFRDNRYSLQGASGRSGGGKGSSINIGFNSDKAALYGVQAVDTMPSVWSMINNSALRKEMGIGQKQFDYGKVLDSYVADPYKDQRKKEGKKRDTGEDISKIASGLSSITSGLKSIGIDVPNEIESLISILQGVSSIIQGVQTIISVFSMTSMPANTAALIANTAALTADTVTNFIPVLANGGVIHAASGYSVPGNSFSGDNIPIMANAGEVVLTQAMAGNLASQLRGGGMQNMRLTATVTGEDIILSVNNTLKRKNRGELATWR